MKLAELRRNVGWLFIGFVHGMRVATPNDPKLSDRRGWRDRCAAGSAGSSGRDSRAGSLQRMVRRLVIWKFCVVNALLEWRLRASVRALGRKEARWRAQHWRNAPDCPNRGQLYRMGVQVLEALLEAETIQATGVSSRAALPDRRSPRYKDHRAGGEEQHLEQLAPLESNH